MHRTRRTKTARVGLALTALVTLAACGSTDKAETPTTAAAADSTAAMTDTTDAMAETTDAMSETTDAMTDTSALAAWQTLPITDVDGVVFTLADLIGTPVVVENFATWCPTCRAQLKQTDAAAAELGEDAVVVALSVETDLSSSDVAEYAEANGFDHVRFAVMSPELLAAMVDAFGNSAANPPSTPKIVIDAMGHPGELTTGSESTDEIVAAVRQKL